jgi:hypothetical protein
MMEEVFFQGTASVVHPMFPTLVDMWCSVTDTLNQTTKGLPIVGFSDKGFSVIYIDRSIRSAELRNLF